MKHIERYVWEAYSKTFSILFASEDAARQYVASFPTSVSGGISIIKRDVISPEQTATTSVVNLEHATAHSMTKDLMQHSEGQAASAGHTAGKNEGHGRVYPRPDGVKARCGGPIFCKECAADLARKSQEAHTPVEQWREQAAPSYGFTPFAHEELAKFYTEWPGGLDEVESAMRWRDDEIKRLKEALPLSQTGCAPMTDKPEAATMRKEELIARFAAAVDYVALHLPSCPVKDCTACAEREKQIAVLREAAALLTPARDEGLEGVSDLPGLIGALEDQTQCDQDGIMCQVSRQAVDEALTVLRALSRPLAQRGDEHIHTIECRAKGCSISGWQEDLRVAPASLASAGMPEYPKVHKWPVPHPQGKPVADVVDKRDYDKLRAYALRTAAPGMVSVPREPTREMQLAGGNILKPHMEEPLGNLSVAARAYKAMLAAAPLQSNGTGKEER